LAAVWLASCAPVTPTASKVAQRQRVVIALGYVPSVQFAPFYVAQSKGFFADEGLLPEFRNGFETDYLKLVASGEIPFVVGSGEEVLLGRAQGLPVVYVARWYTRFPVGIFALASSGIRTPADLIGKKVGIPGPYGASYVGWKAFVYANHLDESKIKLENIGFTQAAAVSDGRVDAAVDYVVNGPVQLRLAGKKVNVMEVSDQIDLPSNGLITNEQTINQHPELVRKVTRAMLRGIQYTLAHPDEAFAISLRAVPEAGGKHEAANRAIFDAALRFWRPQDGQFGRTTAAQWTEAERFMRKMGLLQHDVDVSRAFTNQFVAGTGQ